MGCGGGRHQILDQTFKTGGFRINSEVNLHVDPGPGALLLTTQLGLDPMDLDAIFVSHSHTDHRSDTEVLMEAVKRKSPSGGRFIGSESAVNGAEGLSPAVSKHHQRKIGEIVSLKSGDSFEFEGLKLEATPTKHSDPTTIGFMLHTESGTVGYTSDTEYFDELIEAFEGCDVLMANITRPGDKRIRGHLCSQDLIELLDAVEPSISVILHMGMLFLRNSPERESQRIMEATGVRTIPGYVGTKIEMDGEISVGKVSRQKGIGEFS